MPAWLVNFQFANRELRNQKHSLKVYFNDVTLYAIEFVESHALKDLIDKGFLEGIGI